MTTKQMVVDKDSPHVEPEDEKESCLKFAPRISGRTQFSERGQQNEQKIVCSVKIEIPNIEGTFHIKGDAKPTKKEAENSSADHMIRALESSVMSLVITNLQMHENLDGKKKNLQMKES
ncbi:Ribonuclease 3-like protein 3 [Arabidopsis thaliana]